MAEQVPQRELFIWKTEHDRCFVRELLIIEPYIHKQQSKERGQAWKLITDNLNRLEKPQFRVTARSVRDRFNKLIENFKKNEREEARATGIKGADFDELYRGLTDIHERMAEAKLMWEETNEKEKNKESEEKKKAEDMRKKATESLSETKKRKEVEGSEEETPKRKRKSTQAFALVEEGLKLRNKKEEREQKQQEEELEERRQARQSQRDMFETQQTFLAGMQMQQQQFMVQMQQQQLQALSTLTDFMNSFNKH